VSLRILLWIFRESHVHVDVELFPLLGGKTLRPNCKAVDEDMMCLDECVWRTQLHFIYAFLWQLPPNVACKERWRRAQRVIFEGHSGMPREHIWSIGNSKGRLRCHLRVRDQNHHLMSCISKTFNNYSLLWVVYRYKCRSQNGRRLVWRFASSGCRHLPPMEMSPAPLHLFLPLLLLLWRVPLKHTKPHAESQSESRSIFCCLMIK